MKDNCQDRRGQDTEPHTRRASHDSHDRWSSDGPVPALLPDGAACTDWERDMITKSSTLFVIEDSREGFGKYSDRVRYYIDRRRSRVLLTLMCTERAMEHI